MVRNGTTSEYLLTQKTAEEYRIGIAVGFSLRLLQLSVPCYRQLP